MCVPRLALGSLRMTVWERDFVYAHSSRQALRYFSSLRGRKVSRELEDGFEFPVSSFEKNLSPRMDGDGRGFLEAALASETSPLKPKEGLNGAPGFDGRWPGQREIILMPTISRAGMMYQILRGMMKAARKSKSPVQ